MIGEKQQAHSSVQLVIESGLRNELDKTLEEIGTNLASAFTLFAESIVREKKLPFDRLHHQSSREEIKSRLDDIKARRAVLIETTIDELRAELNDQKNNI